jgi:hypothetical protein
VRDVELESLSLQQTSGFGRLFTTAIAQIDIGPTGESILFVPGALAVAQQDQPIHDFLVLVEAGLTRLNSELNQFAAI